MKANSTHITIIADRSGSMIAVKSDAEGAINAFLDEQTKLSGDCTLLLVDFDDSEPFRIVHDGPLDVVEPYVLKPRGNTPLHDAIGKGIAETGVRLAALEEDERPEVVIFVVQTDGAENASREYTADQVKAMIDEQDKKWNWKFIFLAAGPAAWGASRHYAGTQLAGNVLRSSGDAKSYGSTASYMSEQVSNLRAGAQGNFSGIVNDDGSVTETDAAEVTNQA